MHPRLGAKDLVTWALLVVIGAGVWITAVQRDREWARLVRIDRRLDELESQIARLGDQPAPGARAAAPAPASAAASAWARPGVPVVQLPPLAFTNDPRRQPGFRPDGEFTEIFDGEPARLTPHIAADASGRRVYERVVEPLADYDPLTLEPRGVLAEAWQADPEFRWLRVRLRGDVTFSDGVPVTAEDVRYTFMDYVLNPEIDAVRLRSVLDMIERVDVIDDRTVEFAFSRPVFTNIESAVTTHILPRHVYGKLDPATINQSTGLLVGSGPFRMEQVELADQWAPGQDIVLVRNERYWGPKPPLRSMRFKTIENEVARLNAYRAGEGDMIEPGSLQFLTVPEEPGWREANQALNWVNMRSRFAFLGWNCGERKGRPTPFTDPRVRRAMTHAIDRERIVRDVYEGLGEVCTGPGPRGSLSIDPSIAPWPYDMEKARALLAEAGWRDRDGSGVLRDESGRPFEFEFLNTKGSKTGGRIAEYVAEQCRELGIVCTVRTSEWAVVQELTGDRDYDVVLMGWQFNGPESDPKQAYHSSSIPGRGDNFMQWRHPEADRLIEAGRGELDAEKRRELWCRLHRLIHEEQPQTFLVSVPWKRFVRREIGNVHPYRSGLEPQEFFRAAGPLPP